MIVGLVNPTYIAVGLVKTLKRGSGRRFRENGEVFKGLKKRRSDLLIRQQLEKIRKKFMKKEEKIVIACFLIMFISMVISYIYTCNKLKPHNKTFLIEKILKKQSRISF